MLPSLGISGDSGQENGLRVRRFILAQENPHQGENTMSRKHHSKKVAAHLMKASHKKGGRKRGGKRHSKKTITKA